MLRAISRLAAIVIFALLIFGAALPIPETPHAGTQADPWLVYNTPNVSLAWDAGDPSTYGIEVRVLDETGAEVTSMTVLRDAFVVKPDGDWKIEIRTLTEPLANGLYQLSGRHFDVVGNVSEWSPAIWLKKDWRTLPTPGGCGIFK